MLEGGGKTPILSPVELEEIGYKIIAYPLSLIGVSMRRMAVCFSFIYVNIMFFIHIFE
jgi:2-methylisocitrate lyase-like PEP mutase family enzyme